MATGLPAATGDILTAATVNGLITFTLNAQSGATYTVANVDVYQALVQATNASTKTITIAPDSTLTAAAVGTAITFLNSGAGLLTFAAGAGVTIVSAGAVSTAPTLAQYKTAVAIRLSANSWTIVGGIS
jgi:uncharacterized MnhB-related membrane protein